MKSTNTNLTTNPRKLAALCGSALILVSLATQAIASQRPLSDFVSRQGSYCLVMNPDGSPNCQTSHYGAGAGCFLFLPPTPNFTGWSDPNAQLSASVDYAGLMDQTLQTMTGGAKSLGTSFSGMVSERPQADGTAEVTVILDTHNALTWVVQGFDYAADPLVFGHRVQDVASGATPALGDSHLKIVFNNSRPGALLPDVEELFFCRLQDVKFASFEVRAAGTLGPASGQPDGTPGFMQTTQTGVIGAAFRNNFNGRLYDAFPAEHIRVHAAGQ